MQSVSSRIWTRIAAFISYGDNDYTTGTSMIWWWGSNNAGVMGNAEYPFTVIAPRSTLVVAPDRFLSMSQIEVFDI